MNHAYANFQQFARVEILAWVEMLNGGDDRQMMRTAVLFH
jgi:hypothetical protein